MSELSNLDKAIAEAKSFENITYSIDITCKNCGREEQHEIRRGVTVIEAAPTCSHCGCSNYPRAGGRFTGF